MAVYLGQWEPGSPEWHAARAGRIGGSDIAAILGLSPWTSRFSLWHERKGLVPPQAEKPEMTWGKRLEPVICDAFQEGHPNLGVLRVEGAVFAHDDRPWQVASPDARLYARRLDFNVAVSGLEVKTDRFDDGWGKTGTDEIPVYYQCQVQWCMDVFDLPEWHVAFLCSGSDYREYVIKASASDQAFMRAEAEAFLASLDAGERPDIDEHGATYETVRALHPDIDRGPAGDIELSADTAAPYCRARKALAAAEGEERRAKTVVLDAMGRARRALFGEQVIATRQARGDGTPYLVAGKDLPHFPEDSDSQRAAS
jgi:putative phage-type endonuclease